MSPEEQVVEKYSDFTKAIFQPTDRESVEFVGSGSLFKIDGRFYLFTAGHVLDRATDTTPLLFNAADRLIPITGMASNSRTTFPLRRDDDQINLAVVQLPIDVNSQLDGTAFLKTENLDLNSAATPEIGYLVIGYPDSKNRESVNKLSKEIRPFLYSVRCWESDGKVYGDLGLSNVDHLVLNFDRKRVYDRDGDRKQLPPALNGLSGAPIWGGTPAGVAVVVSVLTEHHKRSEKCIVSTRINRFYQALAELRLATGALSDA
jgi:hypothetical protein